MVVGLRVLMRGSPAFAEGYRMSTFRHQTKMLLQKSPALYGLARKLRDSLANPSREDGRTKVVALTPEQPSRGNVLLSFINEPFFLTRDQAGYYGQHMHYGSALEMARAFLDLGYSVDVIRWNNDEFLPQKDYAFFIDKRLNLERIGPMLNEHCLKIMYIETAHWLFHMTAQHRRLLALQQRKGVTLKPKKTVTPNWGIEHASCAVTIGNEFTINTYRYANRPIYRLPVVSPMVYPWPDSKNFDSCRKHFLWFGSDGLVHKGLDLVLDAFAELPEYHLTVCGPIRAESDFEKIYYKELYHTPNIHTLGWIAASSPEFREIVKGCLGLIYPSCSEGGSGSVITCMHAGLVPIISYESGIDVDDFGMILTDNSVAGIKDALQRISNLPVETLKGMAGKAWEIARMHYIQERFAAEFRKTIEILDARHRRAQLTLS
jgi:glycosyltransferase involved in cell wall biosynthesis